LIRQQADDIGRRLGSFVAARLTREEVYIRSRKVNAHMILV
jgi:hypothetical protein